MTVRYRYKLNFTEYSVLRTIDYFWLLVPNQTSCVYHIVIVWFGSVWSGLGPWGSFFLVQRPMGTVPGVRSTGPSPWGKMVCTGYIGGRPLLINGLSHRTPYIGISYVPFPPNVWVTVGEFSVFTNESNIHDTLLCATYSTLLKC